MKLNNLFEFTTKNYGTYDNYGVNYYKIIQIGNIFTMIINFRF